MAEDLEAHEEALENPSVSCLRDSQRPAPRAEKEKGRRLPAQRDGKTATSAGAGREAVSGLPARLDWRNRRTSSPRGVLGCLARHGAPSGPLSPSGISRDTRQARWSLTLLWTQPVHRQAELRASAGRDPGTPVGFGLPVYGHSPRGSRDRGNEGSAFKSIRPFSFFFLFSCVCVFINVTSFSSGCV